MMYFPISITGVLITLSSYFTLILFFASTPSVEVSIRRRKNIFGLQWEPNQRIEQARSVERQGTEKAASESSIIISTVQGSSPSQIKRKRGRPQIPNKKPFKSTEAVKRWYKRQKEARERGDKKAIEFFKKENKRRTSKSKAKREKIFSGEATQTEKDQYERQLARNKKYKESHPEIIRAYKKRWRERQKAKALKD
jgi:hypothetical protein